MSWGDRTKRMMEEFNRQLNDIAESMGDHGKKRRQELALNVKDQNTAQLTIPRRNP